jgi:hypothetical protein
MLSDLENGVLATRRAVFAGTVVTSGYDQNNFQRGLQKKLIKTNSTNSQILSGESEWVRTGSGHVGSV